MTIPAGARRRELRIGESGRRPTLMFNGYEEQVGSLYAGMDLDSFSEAPMAESDAEMKDVGFAKFVLLVNGLVPGTLLLWDAYHGQAGANPVNYAIRTTGILALIFLCLSLLVTPLRKITGLNWLFHFRRLLGLYAFFYALAHFSIFFVLDRVIERVGHVFRNGQAPYLIVGSVGLLAMVPLAATSTNYMIKRHGPETLAGTASPRLCCGNCRSRAFLHAGQIGHPPAGRLRQRGGNLAGISSGGIFRAAVEKSVALAEGICGAASTGAGRWKRTTPRRADRAGNPERQDVSPGSARSKRLSRSPICPDNT